MVFYSPPPGGSWNPLSTGGSKALSLQFRAPLRSYQAGAAVSASSASSLRTPRSRRSTNLRKNALELLRKFPLKVACTAGALSLTGDTIAQLMERLKRGRAAKLDESLNEETRIQEMAKYSLWNHDYWRALRMSSYGFLLYAPGTKQWYESLDRVLVGKSVTNVALKVLANQVILGPAILFVVFGWNYFWMGKLKELPAKYKKDMVPSIINAWKFWLPATCLNFWAVPLDARVTFMSTCGIFWNFYLSSNVSN